MPGRDDVSPAWEAWQASLARRAELATRFLAEASSLALSGRSITFGAWSVKDVLAHLIAWDLEAIVRFGQFLAGPTQDRDYDVDSFNRSAVVERRNADWHEIADEFRATQERFTAIASRVRPGDVEREGRFCEWVVSLADHYDHHLRRLLEVRGSGG